MMMLDATQHFSEPLMKDRLFGWHAALFPTGRSGMHRITVGGWRTKCSLDTALRDIQNFKERGIFIQNLSGGRSTSYHLADQ